MPLAHSRGSMGRGAALAILCFVAYTVLAIAYTYPLAANLDRSFLHGIDFTDAYQLTWVLAWVQHAIVEHVNPYNAPIFYPNSNTLGYIDSLFPIAIITFPVLQLTHNPLIVYNLAVLLSFPCSAIAMYALANYHVRDRRAAFLAGLVFAYAPFRARHLEHLNMLNAECIPLILLSFELARRKGGRLPWLALSLSLLLGACTSLYYLAFTCVGMLAYAAVLTVKRERVFAPGSFRGIEFALLSSPLVVLSLVPYAAIQSVSTGPRRLQDMAFFSADVRDYLHSAPQSLLYGWTDSLMHLTSLDARQFLFPGFGALALAIYGCVRHAGTRNNNSDDSNLDITARTHFAVACVMAVFTLGPYLRLFGWFTQIPLPYMAVYFLAPPLRGLRDVARYEQVGLAFLGVALAIGAVKLLRSRRAKNGNYLFIAVGMAITAECWIVQRPLIPVPSARAIPAVYQWLSRQPPGVMVELPLCDPHLPGSICTEEFTYMYYQSYHWDTLVNGWAGSYPNDWGARVTLLRAFPSIKSIDYLQSLQVRYVIIHPRFDGRNRVDAWIKTMQVHRKPVLEQVRDIGGDLVLQLRPQP